VAFDCSYGLVGSLRLVLRPARYLRAGLVPAFFFFFFVAACGCVYRFTYRGAILFRVDLVVDHDAAHSEPFCSYDSVVVPLALLVLYTHTV